MTVPAINLALQGGGAHGAFTWGVLDHLLESGAFRIEAISGTSAGAMNAVALAHGWQVGGADGAREMLDKFWRRMAREARFNPIQPTPVDLFFGNFNLDGSPSALFFDLASRFFSPYDLNPLNLNPLRDLVDELVDFERVRACHELKLFISAVNVHTGKPRVFHREELTADMVMASACLPTLFQAVEIEGVPYWDGGFGGNPVLYPFTYHTKVDDIVLVQINPVERRDTPRTAREIQNRMNEITFNAALLRELRAIEFVSRLTAEGRLDERYRAMRVHRIDGGGALHSMGLNASSKLNTSWSFLSALKRLGRDTAAAWMTEGGADIGVKGMDLRAMFK